MKRPQSIIIIIITVVVICGHKKDLICGHKNFQKQLRTKKKMEKNEIWTLSILTLQAPKTKIVKFANSVDQDEWAHIAALSGSTLFAIKSVLCSSDETDFEISDVNFVIGV